MGVLGKGGGVVRRKVWDFWYTFDFKISVSIFMIKIIALKSYVSVYDTTLFVNLGTSRRFNSSVISAINQLNAQNLLL